MLSRALVALAVLITAPVNPIGPTRPSPFVIVDSAAHNVASYRFNDEVNEESVKAALDAIDRAESEHATSFLLEINTPGGDVDEGFKLAKRIEDSKMQIACVVDGKAASMGFYILQSCSTRAMTKRSALMTHEPSLGGMFAGRQNDWASVAAAMKAISDGMAEHCNHRLTTTIKQYHDHTDGNKQWWFSWSDAQKFKAVDKVVDSVKEILEKL